MHNTRIRFLLGSGSGLTEMYGSGFFFFFREAGSESTKNMINKEYYDNEIQVQNLFKEHSLAFTYYHYMKEYASDHDGYSGQRFRTVAIKYP